MSDLNVALIIEAVDKAMAHPRVGGKHVCRSARVSRLIFRVTPVMTTPRLWRTLPEERNLFQTRIYRPHPCGQGGVVPIPLLWRGARQGGVVI